MVISHITLSFPLSLSIHFPLSLLPSLSPSFLFTTSLSPIYLSLLCFIFVFWVSVESSVYLAGKVETKPPKSPSDTAGICQDFLLSSMLYASSGRRETLDKAAIKHHWDVWQKKKKKKLKPNLTNILIFLPVCPNLPHTFLAFFLAGPCY